jgi:diadenosine tetraphosphate (Ap4A) HIT family hydrolase
MALKKEEIDTIKTQLLGQIDNFPEDKREAIKTQIQSMNNDQVEEFVKQNELTHMPGGCIFCSIVEGKSQSIRVAEDENSIAILEINPLSKGHSLIVPKKHGEKVGVRSQDMAEELSKKMKKVLGVNDVTIREIQIMDHALLEVIPIYGDETERKQATKEELTEMREILTGEIIPEEMVEKKVDAEKVLEAVEEEKEEIVKLPERIPRFS